MAAEKKGGMLVAQTEVTVDGVGGHSVLVVADSSGNISLSYEGQPVASSEDSEDDNLYRLRTARNSVLAAFQDLLGELEALAGSEGNSTAASNVTNLRAILAKV